MAFRPYERVSAFSEATTVDAEDDRPSQSLFPPTTSRIYPHYPEFNYKPLVLKHASLLTLLLVAGALIGLLEYAVIRLPHSAAGLTTRSINTRSVDNNALRVIYPRQNSSESTSTTSSSILENTLESAYVELWARGNSNHCTCHSSQRSRVWDTWTRSYVGELSFWPPPSCLRNLLIILPIVFRYVQTSSTATFAYTMASSAYVDTAGTVTVSHSSKVTPNTLMQTRSEYVATKTTSVLLATTIDSAYVTTKPATASGSAIPASLDDEGKGTVVYHWNAQKTFQGTYLAILIAVLYRMLWMMVYNSFNLIDPFLGLMQPGGASAADAFFTFYQSQSNLLGPIPAMLRKRWMLALVAIAYAVAGLLPAFASESIFVDTDWGCPHPNLKHKANPCKPRISVDVTVVRVLQGLIAFTAAALIGITVYLVFKKTGLPADPRSIATVGSLMQHPVLIDDLNGIPVNSTRDEMQRSMREKTYTLGFYKLGPGQQAYGIKPAVEDNWSTSSRSGSFKYEPVGGYNRTTNRTESTPSRFRIVDLLLLLASLGAFGVVLAYYLDGDSDGFNNFFNSNTFGPRFILTLAGTAIASMWKSVEQSAIVMAPFKRMASKASPPRGTILFIPSSTPISSTWRSARSGYIMVSIITSVTLLAEALNITISGVPFASGQTWQQFIVSTYLSMAILGIMIITSMIIIISRSREPRIPRKPDTLGPMMSYMSGSRMLDDFLGREMVDARSRDRLILQADKTYEFREALRIDGKVAWRVDETSKHGSYSVS